MEDSKFLDKNGLLYVWQKIKTLLGGKVDKVDGKGLSTNDYTTTEKNKLNGISSNAQVNVIESVKVNGSAITVSSKAVNITVPTNNNQLTNGAGYQTSSDVENTITGKGYQTSAQVESAISNKGYQTSAQVSNAIADALKDITGIEYKILTNGEYNANGVPTVSGKSGVIYLVPKTESETNNIYEEYIYTGTSFEKIGDTSVDMSGYLTITDVITNTEIDTIFAS